MPHARATTRFFTSPDAVSGGCAATARPGALAGKCWLESVGQDAIHVSDLDMMGADDRAIWQYAVDTGSVIVTKDEDFAILSDGTNETGPSVVWLRVGNTRKAELLRWFEPLLPRILNELDHGERLVEVASE